MSVRKIEFLVSADNITPDAIVFGGRQYEHNATQIDFVIDDGLYSLLSEQGAQGKLVFRIDAVNGEGGYIPLGSVEPTSVDGKFVLSYKIGYEITSMGGRSKFTIVASCIEELKREEMIFCSAPAIIEFEPISRNEIEVEQFEKGLSGILEEAKGCIIETATADDEGNFYIKYANGKAVCIDLSKLISKDSDTAPKWRKVADIELAENTNSIEVVNDTEGNVFTLDKIAITAGLKVTKTPAPYMVKINDCNVMQIKTCDNLNTDVNRYMNITAETYGDTCVCSANVASVASSLGCAGEEGENLTRHGFSKYNFSQGINKIVLKNFEQNTYGVPTSETQIDVNKTYSYRRLTNLDDGIHIEFDVCSGYLPYRYTENVGGISEGGLKLKFRNYQCLSDKENLKGFGQLVIILSGFGGTPDAPSDATTKIKKYVPFLQLDTVNGALYLASCNDIQFGTQYGFTIHQTIIKSDALKYVNLVGTQFDIIIKDNDKTGCVINRDYEVTVVIDGVEVASGVIHSELLKALQYHPKTDSCYVSIGSLDNDGNNPNAWSVEFLGFENQEYGQFAKGSTMTVWGLNK